MAATPPEEAEDQNPTMESDLELLHLSCNPQGISGDGSDRRWEDLNPDCLVNVFERVGTGSLLVSVPFVCKSWYRSSLNPACWQRLIVPDDVPGTDSFDINGTDDLSSYDVQDEEARFKDFVRKRFAIKFQLDLRGFSTASFFKFVIDRSMGNVKFLKLPTGSYALEVVLEHVKEKCKSFCGLNVCDADIGKKAASAIVKFVPKIKYLWLRRARIGRQGLVTLLQGCKDLELLDVRECSGFDEGDEEIAELAASIPKFMCEGSSVGQGGGGQRILYGYRFGGRRILYVGGGRQRVLSHESGEGNMR
ncbi:putative F-box domain, leucine-rich repeat domain, L domain-containing protein [Rosa chinensis]|uniref:Putative F-box domain, leucine-rich repeat domain, L domain-containing protein n=1 Tax=Rosa chinensis TaxID=74649 RepID=A0A2P6SJF4_ROSCH|nr:putative F-box domain, leucine-rich repeat domain, L domain-containing protein [Rosa chinensis]